MEKGNKINGNIRKLKLTQNRLETLNILIIDATYCTLNTILKCSVLLQCCSLRLSIITCHHVLFDRERISAVVQPSN